MAPIRPGLFKAAPRSLIVLPVLLEGQVKVVTEPASFSNDIDLQLSFLEQLTASIGIVLNGIEATMQTEGLSPCRYSATSNLAGAAEDYTHNQRRRTLTSRSDWRPITPVGEQRESRLT